MHDDEETPDFQPWSDDAAEFPQGEDAAAGVDRMNALIKRAQAMPAAEVTPESEEALYRYLGALDGGPDTTHARQLIQDGIVLTDPDAMDDGVLHDKLWEVICGLAKRRVFLSSTNHLSDRELYTYLWKEALNEWTVCLDDSMGKSATHLDLLGGGSEADAYLWLKYYASESERKIWLKDYPNHAIPPRAAPLCDRDGRLPKQDDSLPEGY